jgi:hypothetical protein
VPNQAKLSLPICVQKPLMALWRARKRLACHV